MKPKEGHWAVPAADLRHGEQVGGRVVGHAADEVVEDVAEQVLLLGGLGLLVLLRDGVA